mmetsp:Transcript_7565/g.19400  ORF Transcript_7565/g.19400 Transcript_7565/m.19400 type:complete len:286 (+) Transcript_7565:579-1436(+)
MAQVRPQARPTGASASPFLGWGLFVQLHGVHAPLKVPQVRLGDELVLERVQLVRFQGRPGPGPLKGAPALAPGQREGQRQPVTHRVRPAERPPQRRRVLPLLLLAALAGRPEAVVEGAREQGEAREVAGEAEGHQAELDPAAEVPRRRGDAQRPLVAQLRGELARQQDAAPEHVPHEDEHKGVDGDADLRLRLAKGCRPVLRGGRAPVAVRVEVPEPLRPEAQALEVGGRPGQRLAKVLDRQKVRRRHQHRHARQRDGQRRQQAPAHRHGGRQHQHHRYNGIRSG